MLGNHRAIGGDPSRSLEPNSDAARIRAVFAHPDWTRQGIARRLVDTAEAAARQAGFWRFMLVSTLNAEPLYRRLGYKSIERVYLDLPNLVRLPTIRMAKELPRRPCGDDADADPMTSNAA
jgi:GNAT superfamily N-acetyltransferase